MDSELRQAEREANWQRVYSLLCRQGEYEKAEAIILDHPIQITCTVRYRWRMTFNYNDDTLLGKSIAAYTLDDLVKSFLEAQIGASQIIGISRNPVYQLLDGEIETNWHSTRGPLPRIDSSTAELEAIKDLIKGMPTYLQHATPEQLRDAQRADARDWERLRRRIEQELQQKEAQQRKQARLDSFNQDSRHLKRTLWDLWGETMQYPRSVFAEKVENHPLRFILFKLKDILDAGQEVTHQDFEELWCKTLDQRRARWRKTQT